MSLTLIALEKIASAARAVGFHRTAALRVGDIEDEYQKFYQGYLARGLAADLKYLSRPERFTLTSIFPEAQTLILFLYPYRFRAVEEKLKAAPFKVARYAWQKDYHIMLKQKLHRLLEDLALTGRAVTDSAPLFERYWARRAGLGFIGKNGMLIDRETGSYFFIAAALVGEEIQGDFPLREKSYTPAYDFTEFCKDCRLCVDACPTAALTGDGLMATTRCISYQTIESKTAPVFSTGTKKHRWLFGCDICQQVCPYNKGKSAYADEHFNDEHEAAARIAAGESITEKARLKSSVFLRRGSEKIAWNRAALEA